MNPSILSLLGLVVSIVAGVLTKVNTGLLAIGMAFLTGMLAGIDPKEIVLSWPTNLFMMLFGMSLLFGISAANGTLNRVVEKSVNALKGHVRLLPLLIFIVTALMAAIGPGNIALVAMMMPLAIAMAREEKISYLLMTSMVILGANAGGLSPIAPTGIIAQNLARQEGLYVSATVFRDMIAVSTLCGIVTYILSRGYRIPRNPLHKDNHAVPFTREQKITMAVTALAVLGIIAGGNIALTAFLASGCLLLFRVTTEKEALSHIPWSAIMLVCGVATMISLVNKTHGTDIVINWLSRFTGKNTASPIMAFLGGLMSLFSSASGVVMPTLIPTVTGVAAKTGWLVRPEPLVSSIVIGSHLVSISPFSTLGALAMAAAGSGREKDRLFLQLITLAVANVFIAAFLSYFILFLY